MWRRITGVRGLPGLRRSLFAAALLSLTAAVVELLIAPMPSARWEVVAALSLVSLGARWARMFTTRRASLAGDLAEGVAITALGASLGADNVMPVIFCGLVFRSAYGSRRRALGGGAMYAAAQVFAAAIAHGRFPDYGIVAALIDVPLLLMVPTAAFELARGLIAIEAGARREHALAQAVSAFLTASDRGELDAITALATVDVLGERARDDEPLSPADERWLRALADQKALAVAAHEARAERAAADVAQRIRTLIERSGGVALVVDAKLGIVSASGGTFDVLGQHPGALVGRSLLELVHSADRARALDALEAMLHEDPTAPERITVRTLTAAEPCWTELALADLLGDERAGAFVVQLHDVSSRVALEEDVRRRDGYDGLTRLPNRQTLERALADELRAGAQPAVAVIDMEAFSTINATLGHAVGDEVLAEVGRRLAYATATRGMVARLAGDAFAILLHGMQDPSVACATVEEILKVLASPLDAGPGTVRVSPIAGLAVARSDLNSPPALLAAADIAREATVVPGTCSLFAVALHGERLERATLQAELAVAVGAGQLQLDYQPIADAATGAWVAAEALVRWRHPELGRIPPARFIGLAEESELIIAIGEWVLGEACGQLAAWRAAGLVSDDFAVTVNISGVHLGREELVEHVQAALAGTALPPGNLIIEITETAVVDLAGTLPRMERLKQLGVRIAIDDFGTGHSSLAYLKDLPADVVKLPRPFVRDTGTDSRSRAIVRGLAGLARELGLIVVAEGVETPEQRACVADAGCALIQGFLYSPPLPPTDFAGRLASAAQAGRERGVGLLGEPGDARELLARAAELASARATL